MSGAPPHDEALQSGSGGGGTATEPLALARRVLEDGRALELPGSAPWLRSLLLRNWRNYGACEVSFAPGLNVVYGGNGQGKTSLLEAVYFLGNLVSFRTSSSSSLVRWGSRDAFLDGLCDPGPRLGVRLLGGRRRLLVDGLPAKGLSEYLGKLPVLVFALPLVRALGGSPEERRRVLDRAVAHWVPGAGTVLSQYRRAIRARNRLLRQGDLRAARAYDGPVSRLGARVARWRLDFLARLSEPFQLLYRGISGSDPEAAVGYRSGWLGDAAAEPGGVQVSSELQGRLEWALRQGGEQDVLVGRTRVGPHADDFALYLSGRDARSHASQGQMQSLAAAFVLAQWCVLAAGGRPGILLVDDLSSELDEARRARLLDIFSRLGSQVFVSSTEESVARREMVDRAFRVERGELVTVE